MRKSSLFDSQPILTVGEFLEAVDVVLQDFEVVVQGEVSGVSHHATGLYFSLQDPDKKALVQCYMPPFVYKACGVALQDGMQVHVGGQASMYKPKGRFSFLVRTIELTGEGAIQKAYELLKKQLAAEGLFERKRELPACVSRIALVTSATGAVQADFRTNIIRRGIRIDLYDVLVEGARAATDIVSALQRAYTKDYDIVVLVRGGGSLEDLQAFNSEAVARALYASPVPTVCAIGHDRDTPIAQLIADVNASTPTAAAGVVSDTWSQAEMQLVDFSRSLRRSYEELLTDVYHRLSQAAFVFSSAFSIGRQRLRELQHQLLSEFSAVFHSQSQSLGHAQALLTSVDPKRLLAVGYSITRTAQGSVVRSVGSVLPGDILETVLADGTISSTVQKPS